MEEQEEGKGIQDQEKDIVTSSFNQKNLFIMRFLVIILIIVCSASFVSSILTLLLLVQNINNNQLFLKTSNRSSLIPHVIEQAEARISESDYETAHLMILNALISFPAEPDLFKEYERILSTIVSDIDDPQTVFWILNTGETFIMSALLETDPSHFPNISRVLELIKDKRSEYLEALVERIWELEKEGDVDKVNLLVKNYAGIFSHSSELIDNLMNLLLKRLERLSMSENPSLGLAYNTFEIALSFEENLAASIIDNTFIKEKINRMNELISNMEKKELEKEVDSLCNMLSIEESRSEDEELLPAKIQSFIAKAQQLVNNPLIDDRTRERIYREIYKFQKTFQGLLARNDSNNLKEYNQWVLDILKKYEQNWEVSRIIEYGRELGKIDTRYLFTEVNLYYNHVLSKIIEKLEKEDDIKRFVYTMFYQVKRSP